MEREGVIIAPFTNSGCRTALKLGKKALERGRVD